MRYHQFCVSPVNTWSKADVQGSVAPRQHGSVRSSHITLGLVVYQMHCDTKITLSVASDYRITCPGSSPGKGKRKKVIFTL